MSTAIYFQNYKRKDHVETSTLNIIQMFEKTLQTLYMHEHRDIFEKLSMEGKKLCQLSEKSTANKMLYIFHTLISLRHVKSW